MRLADELGLPPEGYQGNWIPHQLRPATEDGIFFAGDSAGHCLPLTAEGIRTAFYFGIACGRELRAVLDGPPHARAGARPLPRFSRLARLEVRLACSRSSTRSRSSPRALGAMARTFGAPAPALWAFRHYLRIAPPEYALPAPAALAADRARSPRSAVARATPAGVARSSRKAGRRGTTPAGDLAPGAHVVEHHVGQRRPRQEQEAEHRQSQPSIARLIMFEDSQVKTSATRGPISAKRAIRHGMCVSLRPASTAASRGSAMLRPDTTTASGPGPRSPARHHTRDRRRARALRDDARAHGRGSGSPPRARARTPRRRRRRGRGRART